MAEPLRRVLLVEDDATIRRFVEIALDGDPVALTEADSLREARQCLAGQAFDVVVADLMLGDGSGIDLLQEIGAGKALRVAFSAGIDRNTRARLDAIGVSHFLHKPVSVDELRRVIGAAPASADAPPAGAPAERQSAAQTYFAGDEDLFADYRQRCLQQFAHDIDDGDRLAGAGNAAGLRRLAHSLKSVLTMLGDADGGDAARRLEALAAADARDELAASWQQLRAHLQAQRTG